MRFRFYYVSYQVSICGHFQQLVNSFLNCFYNIGNYANNILIAVKWKIQLVCLPRMFSVNVCYGRNTDLVETWTFCKFAFKFCGYFNLSWDHSHLFLSIHLRLKGNILIQRIPCYLCKCLWWLVCKQFVIPYLLLIRLVYFKAKIIE